VTGRFGKLTLRAALALAALAVVALPFGVVGYLRYLDVNVSDQETVPRAVVAQPVLQSWRDQGSRLPGEAAPVVLAYHDVRPLPDATPQDTGPGGRYQYVVTPEQLDAQLTALEAAGYRTISSAEYVAYLQGAPAPARSVYLTFDDGTHGLWTYADKILERHHMRAASYLITGRIGTHRPYYLSWAEIDRMAGSDRWDFQAHTHDLHSRVPVADGTEGSQLTHRQLDPATGQPEPMAAFEARLRSDVDALHTDFAAHDLPAPALFAYPYSETGDADSDTAATAASRQLLAQRFVASLTNKTREPEPSSRRSAAGGEIGRVEVYASTTPEILISQVTEWTAIPPSATDPFANAWSWRDEHAEPLGTLAGLTGGQTGPTYGTYMPYASADWDGYRVVADLNGLTAADTSGSVVVRTDSAAELTVRVHATRVEILHAGTVVASAPLPAADRHHIAVRVAGTDTTVTVDGTTILHATSPAGPTSTGGFGLAVKPSSAHPLFTGVTVMPA